MKFKASSNPGFRAPSWTRPEGFHLTLRFLGNIIPAQVAAVKDALTPSFSRTRSRRYSTTQAFFRNLKKHACCGWDSAKEKWNCASFSTRSKTGSKL